MYSPSDNLTDANIELSTYPILVQTVEKNKAKFTAEEHRRAIKEIELKRRIGNPTLRTFCRWLNNNSIKNCPVTARDARIAEEICGKDIEEIRGKLVRKRQSKNHPPEDIIMPLELKEKNKKVRIYIDIMNVNRLEFLHSVSEKIELRASSYLVSESKDSLKKAVEAVIKIHENHGFQVQDIDADGQFECLVDELQGVRIDVIDPLEHNNVVERSKRTTKEAIRC